MIGFLGAQLEQTDAFGAEIAADAPYLWYRLGETTGTTALDSSGNSRNGLYFGTAGVSYQQGQTGLVGDADTAVRLLADSGYIRSQSQHTFPLTNATHMLAFKADVAAPAGVMTMWNQNTDPSKVTAARDRGFVLGSDGKLYFTFWDGSATRRAVSSAVVNDGARRLTHVSIGASSTSMYINGVLQETIPYVPGFSYTAYWYVGRTAITDTPSPTNTSAGFRGVVDEAAVFTSALSAARIAAHAAAAGF
ncbi:LamG-like jellyroll fold domain-containing protein [Halopseudomonas aestusnigri]|uniref:LamG-like jellyroll fold domain-containing protein n=1 Tax=Halopseudomonas aestusnigri TaxID=857252 RepID=UPI003B985DA7